MSDVTRILAAIEQGDVRAADKLLPLVYQELRQLAAQRMSKEKPGQTLQATALVHEAYIRLVGAENQNWSSRGHFFAAGARPSSQLEKNDRASELASQIADGEMIHYLNINEKFLEDDGTLPKDIMPDLLHPNERGYKIWAEAIEPKIAELMNDTD